MSVVKYGPPISLAEASAMTAAALAEAGRNDWSMVIAIVDSTGHLVQLTRMDHAQYGSIDVAQAKARSALNFKRPTKVFEEVLAKGGAALRLLRLEGVCPIEGGVPIVRGGVIIGALGVSGAAAQEDGQVAAAALAALS